MKRFTPYIVLCALTAIAVSAAATFMQSTHKDSSPVSREDQEVNISVDEAIVNDGTSGGEELPDTASSRPRKSVSGAETTADAGLPDLPDAEGFVPVTPTGLNAPDPAAGITLIAPPAANSRGSASLSYPILLPPSRNGIAPSLDVEYDSDLADGWLGEGWNIPVPSITVDTRWGVPLYDPKYETETYLLDGVMLAECNGGAPRVAHRGERRARSSGSVVFQTRRGGDFAKIIRKGSSPSNYIWEVTDKNGWTYIYGGSGYELRGNVGGTSVVAEWKLQKVVEPHGDWCKYYYRPLEAALSNGIKSREIYLAEIRVGNREKGETPHTRVLFSIGNRNNSISFNSRYGFVTSRTQHLAQIDVMFQNTMLRKYAFVYKGGQFGKTLLSSILQLDDTGKEVARHDFKYDNSALFRDRLTIEGISSISESKGLSAGGSLYTGVGVVDGSPTTSNTVGLSTSYSHDSCEGESTLADLDGDGVADRIYMDSGKMKYRKGTLSGNALKFGQEREILTVDGANFGKYESGSVNSFSLGAQGRAGIDPFSVAGGKVWNYGSAVSDTYFIDYNGDGLTDIAKDGTIWFNRLVTRSDQSVTPVFGRNSSGTDAPVSGGGSVDGSFLVEDQADIDSMVRHSPMVDAVRVWRAPRAGTVRVSGIARSRKPDVPETAGLQESASEDYDGIQVSLQKNGTVIQDKTISKLGSFVPLSAADVHVEKGDLLMFRLRCGKNVYASGEGKAADWSPTVSYTSFDDGTPVTEQALPGGYSPVVYKASEGVYANGCGAFVANPSAYRSMRLHAVVSKKATGDSIRLRVTEFPCSVQNDADIRELLSAGLPWQEGNLSRNVNITDRSVEDPMTFQAVLSTPSSVDWNFVSAEIWLECTANDDSTYVFPLIPSLEGFEEPVSFPGKFTVPSILGQLQDPLDSVGVSPLLDIGGGGIGVIQPSNSVRACPRVRLSANAPADIDVHYTIRSTDSLVASGTVRVLKGQTVGQAEVSVGKRDLESFDVWTEFFADSVGIISEVFTSWYSGNQPLSLPEKVPAGLNVRVRDARFGILRRGWGAFAFRADSNLYDRPISMESIEIPLDKQDFNRMEWHYLPMASDTSLSRMQGPRSGVYVDGMGMGTARLTVQKICDRGLFPAVPLSADGADGSDGSGAKAVGMRQTYSGSSVFANSGMGNKDFGQSVTVQQGSSGSATQRVMIDLNGDGYPDIAGDKAIQYSDHLGRPSRTVSREEFSEHRSVESSSFGLGGTASVQIPAGSFLRGRFGFLARQSDAAHANASAAVNVAGESQKTRTTKGWADVNGDGLPDKVNYEISSYYLNLGNSFSSVLTPLWQSISDISSTSTTDGAAGGSFTYGNGSFAGGVNTTIKESRSESALVDLNGDGLPDILGFGGNSLNVRYSLGDRFDDMERLPGPGILSETSATAVGGNVAFTVAIPTPLGIKIAVNPGVAVSRTTDRRTASLTDINGDGCPDVVWKDASGGMAALLSQAWKANLLVSVVNSFGGTFDISYSRSEPSYGLPGGKAVMSGLYVDDGISGSGPGLRSRFIYQGGRRDRREREFYGFGKVTECQLDSGTNGATLRSVVREFDVSGYYSKGNLLSECVLDAMGRRLSETVNKYYTYALSPAGKGWSFAERSVYGSDSGAAWTPLRFTEGRVYDLTGRYVPLTQESLAYCVAPGSFGEVRETRFSSKGTLGQGGTGACDLIREHSYKYNNLYMSGLVSSATVRDGSKDTLAYTLFSYSFGKEPCKPVSVTKYNGSSAAAVTDFDYDSHGNVTRKRMPANNNGDRMSYGYVYDTELNMYVTEVTDTFGYTAEVSEYDLRYGIPLVSKDINGYIHQVHTDSLGRVVSVLEPSEDNQKKPYTYSVGYYCRAVVDDTTRKIKHPAYAVAKYYDEPNRKGTDGNAEDHYIHVVALADGFGRTVQVLKEGMVTEPDTFGNPVKRHVWIASGRVVDDPLGRPAETYYPVTLPFDTENRYQISDPAKENPSRTFYDALDRVVRSVLPDGSVTRTAYRVDQSLNAALATVTDALGNRSATLTDGNGNILRAVRYAEGGNIVTSFEYDGLGRMTRVTDADSNVTESKYDLGGRRISVSHPASGLTAFEYDPLGNMVSRQTPRLRKIGKKIEYGYEFGRLVSITYPPEDGQPVNPDNVTLSYGGNNAMHNRRGRLEMRVDGSGAEEFFYGRRGEVVMTRRTYLVPNQTVATYETQWSYDCLGRLLSMTYPDNETVRYSYDLGGNLRAVSGDKFYKYKYVDSIAYDRFGQRRLLYYGNGTVTRYGYDLNRRLNSLRVSAPGGNVPVMDNSYTFDAVGNVTGIAGSAASPSGAAAAVSQTFGYDGLYRLTSAQGGYAGTSASYKLGMGYDNMHRVVSKSMRLAQDGVQCPGSLETGYDLAYSYSTKEGQRFRLDSVTDSHYRTAGGSAAATIKDTHSYGYDADGNMNRVSTARAMSDGTTRGGFFGRGIIWDWENRMLASCDNGFVTTYLYDAGGNRTVKQSGGSMHLHVDSEHTAGATATEGFSLYVGPWMTVNQDRRYTKHIYAGSQRIVSKVGDVSSFSSTDNDPRGVTYVGKDEATGVDSIGTRGRYAAQTARVGGLYAKFGVPYGGRDNNVYPDEVPEPAPERSAGSLPAGETGRFFHHPDHLSSSSRVTDRNGKVVQAVEYVPFGEVFLDLRNSDWSTPYLFNAKELDGETGLYYYGARYYDPRLCLWLSTDPLSILSTANSSYRYCRSNPVNLTDPTGLFDTKSEAQKYANDNFPQAGVLRDTKSGKWFVSLNEDATDSYSTGPVLTRYFGPNKIISNTMSIVNIGVGALSTYMVFDGKYYKWNNVWHQTKTKGIAWRWQKRWNKYISIVNRKRQIQTVAKARNLSNNLTKAGGSLILADIFLSGEIKPSHAVNGVMLGISTTGIGTMVAGAWFLADYGTMGINYVFTGEPKSISDMIDESIGTYEFYEGFY